MRRLRRLVHHRDLERTMDDEMRHHIECEVREHIRAGMSPEEARRVAVAQFGGIEQVKEEARDARGTRALEDLIVDVGYATRVLRRNPGFTAGAVLTFGLGCGAATAIFSVVYGVLLRPLPYADPHRLVVLWERVVILSDGLWRRRFGADPAVVGRTLLIDGTPHSVVGVMSADFEPPQFGWLGAQELWFPFKATPENRAWGRFLLVVARLRSSISLEHARAEMTGLADRLAHEVKADERWTVTVIPLAVQITGDVRTALLVLQGAVGLLLIIAVMNVGTLSLSQTLRRAQELATRRSLGATDGRLFRQLLTRSAVVGVLGAAVPPPDRLSDRIEERKQRLLLPEGQRVERVPRACALIRMTLVPSRSHSESRGGGARKRMKFAKAVTSSSPSSGSLIASHRASWTRSPLGAFSVGKMRFVIPISLT
jgi:hypothetical protein